MEASLNPTSVITDEVVDTVGYYRDTGGENSCEYLDHAKEQVGYDADYTGKFAVSLTDLGVRGVPVVLYKKFYKKISHYVDLLTGLCLSASLTVAFCGFFLLDLLSLCKSLCELI